MDVACPTKAHSWPCWKQWKKLTVKCNYCGKRMNASAVGDHQYLCSHAVARYKSQFPSLALEKMRELLLARLRAGLDMNEDTVRIMLRD